VICIQSYTRSDMDADGREEARKEPREEEFSNGLVCNSKMMEERVAGFSIVTVRS